MSHHIPLYDRRIEEVRPLLAALLAVAKAAYADHTFQADSKRSPLADLDRALRVLDAAHPGWREWTP